MSGLHLKLRLGAALVCGTLSAAGGAFADSGNSGNSGNSDVRLLAATCAACHGTDGRAVPGSGVARLAGLPKADFVQQMRAFREGTRDATVMQQIAKGFADAQVSALGDYFAAQH